MTEHNPIFQFACFVTVVSLYGAMILTVIAASPLVWAYRRIIK